MTYSINLEKATWPATVAILKLDDSFIGTPNYMGVSYFWAYEYRHYMRSTTVAQRKRIHGLLLKAGLDVGAESVDHQRIIITAKRRVR